MTEMVQYLQLHCNSHLFFHLSASFIHTGNNYSALHRNWLQSRNKGMNKTWPLPLRGLQSSSIASPRSPTQNSKSNQQLGLQKNILWLLEAVRGGVCWWSVRREMMIADLMPCLDTLLSNPTRRGLSAIFSQSWQKLRVPCFIAILTYQ